MSRILRTAGIAAATGIAVTLLLAFRAVETLELPARDLALRALLSRPAESTIIVAIDERSLREVGPWPWPRADLARLIDRAADAGARAVILDVLLSDARPGDEVLAKAMRRLPTVSVSVLIEGGQWLVPAPALQSATVVGHGNFELDHDGILRRFASTKQNAERSFTALSIEAASIIATTAVPVGRSIAPMFRTRPWAIPVVSVIDLPRHAPAIRGKLVFVGPTALGLGDRVLTPISTRLTPDPGVSVHAAATESLVRGERVREIPPVLAGGIAALAVGSLVHAWRSPRRTRMTLDAALVILTLLGGQILLAATGIAVPYITLVLAIVVSAAAVETRLMAGSIRQSHIALEDIATRLAEHRAQEIESKRLLAHELKTPLASMRGLTQLLGGFELNDAERKRVAHLLEAEAGKLQSMVSALLDLERLPLRDFRSSSAITDLGALVHARIELIQASAGRPLVASVPNGVFVRADAMLIERVVDNLVGNALKFTPPPSPIHVTVRQTPEEAVLEVEDQGQGIAEEERERIFHRFVRGSAAAGTEGLGLGLSFVAEVAKWHGGRVLLGRATGGGSLFRVVLPLAEQG